MPWYGVNVDFSYLNRKTFQSSFSFLHSFIYFYSFFHTPRKSSCALHSIRSLKRKWDFYDNFQHQSGEKINFCLKEKKALILIMSVNFCDRQWKSKLIHSFLMFRYTLININWRKYFYEGHLSHYSNGNSSRLIKFMIMKRTKQTNANYFSFLHLKIELFLGVNDDIKWIFISLMQLCCWASLSIINKEFFNLFVSLNFWNKRRSIFDIWASIILHTHDINT